MRRYAALLLFLSAATPVAAQPVRGLYFSTGAGVSIPQDERVRSTQQAAPTATAAPSGQAALGYGLGSGLRLELEGLAHGSATSRLEHRP